MTTSLTTRRLGMRSGTRVALLVASVLALLLTGAGTAFGYWKLTANAGMAVSAVTVDRPTVTCAAVSGNGNRVTISWTPNPKLGVTGYRLESSRGTVTNHSATTTSATSDYVADGAVTYTLTALYGSWSASGQTTATGSSSTRTYCTGALVIGTTCVGGSWVTATTTSLSCG